MFARRDSQDRAELGTEQIRSQLASILASKLFESASRHRRFLQFVVEQTLAGKQETIKESVLRAQVR
jgi:hypothetical protein